MRTRPCQPPPHPAPLPGLGRLVIPVLVLTLLVLVPPPRPASAQAQASTGVIRGVVRDALGAPLPEAEVVITHRETGLRTSVRTTPSGTFARPLLPVGTYDVVVRGAGQLGEETAPGWFSASARLSICRSASAPSTSRGSPSKGNASTSCIPRM